MTKELIKKIIKAGGCKVEPDLHRAGVNFVIGDETVFVPFTERAAED